MNAFANKSRYFSHPCGHSFAFANRIINISISFRQVYSVIWVWQYYCLMSNTYHIKVLPITPPPSLLLPAIQSLKCFPKSRIFLDKLCSLEYMQRNFFVTPFLIMIYIFTPQKNPQRNQNKRIIMAIQCNPFE